MAKTKAASKTKPQKKTPRIGSGKPRRTTIPPELALQRRIKAWALRVTQRLTHEEIRIELNNLYPTYALETRQAVTKMLKETEIEYLESHQKEVEAYKAEHAALMDWAITEAIQAWERSKGIIKTVKKRIDQPVEQSMRDGIGDPQMLLRVIQAAGEKGKVFGVYSPIKVDNTHIFDVEGWKKEREERLKKARKIEE